MLTSMGDVLRKAYEKGWLTTRDGNVSLRKSTDGKISEYMYISPKGVRKYIIHPEHIIKLNINADERQFDVSTEFEMHRNLLVDATKSRAVLHVHATHIVAALHAGIDLQKLALEFPEISKYTRVGPSVPAVPAGSHELAMLTNVALRDSNGKIAYDIVGQANHGVCAIGTDPWSCYEHIERLNHICEIVLLSGRHNDKS